MRAALFLSLCISITSAGAASAQTCGNPNDNEPDDAALQACLDRGGIVVLDPGEPGYIINGLNDVRTRGLWITQPGTTITSSAAPTRAQIVAGRDLFAHILRTPPDTRVDNITIEYVSINGMIDAEGGTYRVARDDCRDPGRHLTRSSDMNPGNLVLQSVGLGFQHNESVQALCGSGLALLGQFDVQDNYIAFNGRDRFSGGAGTPWSDGVTVLGCDSGSYFAHNVLVDNTDIALALGGGNGCIFELNSVFQGGRYAFAGINVGNFSTGDHSGSEVRGNTVESSVPDRLGMGILAGSHPWSSNVQVSNAGTIVSNTAQGAVINLVIEGIDAGTISGITVSGNQGSIGFGNCTISQNYTAYHWGNAVIPADPFLLRFDDQNCQPAKKLNRRKK
jgi:hypothetical protein